MTAQWLYEVPGLGRKRLHRIRDSYVERNGTPEGLASLLYKESDLSLAMFFAEVFDGAEAGRVLTAVLEGRKRSPEEAGEVLRRKEMHFVHFDSPDFPERLREIPDPPFALYYRGKLPDPAGHTVSVIGSRGPSDYGRRQARAFGEELAESGVQVISGMARGVDSIAQRAAAECGGDSFGILGCGADVIYPRENSDLYERLAGGQGGVISEYPPGTEPKMGLFPDRNRIIAGMGDVLLVIEAKERSGTLITVDRALEQGRTVFALPGRVEDELSFGCNRLIRQGAEIATEPGDIYLALGMLPGKAAGTGGSADSAGCGRSSRQMKLISLQEPEASLYRILSGNDLLDVEELRFMLGKELHREVKRGEMMRLIMQMESKGFMEEKSPGIYARL